MTARLRYTLLISTIIIFMGAVAAWRLASLASTETSNTHLTLSNVSSANQSLSIDEFANITSKEFDQYTIVNVHIPYEGEVPNTDLQIAYNSMESLTSALPDRDAPIVLYCRSGRMSKEASEMLIELGYTNIWDVKGGMNAWQDSGRALIYTEQSQ